MRLLLKVTPKSGRNAVNGWMGDTLKLSVTAVPEKGKANQAVIELLAGILHVPKSALTIVRGGASAHKQLEIDGLDEGEILRRLRHPAS